MTPRIVRHRERSFDLAQRHHEELLKIGYVICSWPDLAESERDDLAACFDSLIDDGLIGLARPSRSIEEQEISQL